MPEKTGKDTFKLFKGESFYDDKAVIVTGPAEAKVTTTNKKGTLIVTINGQEHTVGALDIDDFLKEHIFNYSENFPTTKKGKQKDAGQDSLPSWWNED